jgi:hypothetical protein
LASRVRYVVLIAVMAMAGTAAARPTLRVPYHDREAMAGCWDVGQGQTLVLRKKGKHLLVQVQGSRRDEVSWDAAQGGAFVQCRPPSRHGSFCVVAPDGQGGLRVRVYRKRHGSGDTGYLREDFVAARC